MTRNLFVHDMKKWQTNCRSHEIDHAQVHEYENALILPLRQKPEFNTPEGVYEGGVCSENFTFIAGRRRRFKAEHANWDCDSSYKVEDDDIVSRNETVIFGDASSTISGMPCWTERQGCGICRMLLQA